MTDLHISLLIIPWWEKPERPIGGMELALWRGGRRAGDRTLASRDSHWDNPRDRGRRAVAFIQVSVIGSLVLGGVIFFVSTPVLSLYQISETARGFAQNILHIFSFTLWLRVVSIVMFIGVLRSGGDTRFSFLVDILSLWLIGIPLALIGAFLLHLPVYYVYLIVMVEEVIKITIVIRRFISRKWINNLALSAAADEIE